METRANYVLVGSSVLAAMLAIVIFVFWLGRSQFTHQEDVYYTYFTGSVAGLSSGSPVRYRGVPVGSVGAIAIDPQNIERIRVTLKITPNTPVKTDTIASLETAGITGNSYVELKGGTQGSARLTGDDGTVPVIQSENSGLQALVDNAPKLLGKLTQLADSANSALSRENIKAISDTLTHLQNVAAGIDGLTPELKEALGNFTQITADLRVQMPKLMDSVREDGAAIKGAADEFHRVATSADAVIAENRGPLRDFTGNGLSEISGLVTQLRSLTTTLTRVADHLDRDPQRYLFGGGASVGVDPNQPIGATIRTGTAR
jgi:phospholipid/cholesterol/gamma-HCH transport system substrate-binding protein